MKPRGRCPYCLALVVFEEAHVCKPESILAEMVRALLEHQQRRRLIAERAKVVRR